MKKRERKIFKKIEDIRKKNNKNWMDLLRLSFKIDQKESKKIVRQIFKSDNKISMLAKKLTK